MLDLSSALLIDLEATGPDPAADRVTQIALLPADGAESRGFLPYVTLVNPRRPQSAEAARLTGLDDGALALAPPFEALAAEVSDLMRDRVLIGFGANGFDVPLLAEEFERARVPYSFGPVIDAGLLFKRYEKRTLEAAVRFYCGRELADAHNAVADAKAAGEVLAAQVRRYDLGTKTVAELAALSVLGDHPAADPAGKLVRINGKVCFNTHRNRHVPVANDIGYAEWMLRSDFPLATKRVLAAEVERYYSPAPTEGERLEDAVADAMGREPEG